MNKLPRYATIQKVVGETPLQAAERLRTELRLDPNVPLAYAGRLDPMASGTLLILIGDECKQQERYHGLDKAYDFSILFGIGSDTGDVLGCVQLAPSQPKIRLSALKGVLKSLVGPLSLPYPHFSARPVAGKPLHQWTLEGRLNEIEIPVKQSRVYSLKVVGMETITAQLLYTNVFEKVATIPTITDPRKALGRDFRREEVRAAWTKIFEEAPVNMYTIAHIRAIASSGTYMRSLAEEIAKQLGTTGLAYAIHRTEIGKYQPLFGQFGYWHQKFK